MKHKPEEGFEVDLRIGVVRLNWTALDRSKAPDYTWENEGIYRKYHSCLIGLDGSFRRGEYAQTPNIMSFLGTLSSDSLKPSLWRYLTWKIKRFFLLKEV